MSDPELAEHIDLDKAWMVPRELVQLQATQAARAKIDLLARLV